MPAGTKCTGGANNDTCLVAFTTAGGFGNCIGVTSGSAAVAGAAVAANTTAAATTAAAAVSTSAVATGGSGAAVAGAAAAKGGEYGSIKSLHV